MPVFWMAHPLFDAAELVAVTVSPPGVAIECTVEFARGTARVGPAGVAPLLPAALEPGGYRKYRLGDAGDVTSVTLVRVRRPSPHRRLERGRARARAVVGRQCGHRAGTGRRARTGDSGWRRSGDGRDRDQLPTLEPGEALQVTVDVVGSRAS